MNRPILNVVRFDESDVIATSERMTIQNAFMSASDSAMQMFTHKSVNVVDPADPNSGAFIPSDDAYGALDNNNHNLLTFIQGIYKDDGTTYGDDNVTDAMYNAIKDAKFFYDGGGYNNVRHDSGYVWIDRDGDGVYNDGEDVTLADVIRSTTGTNAEVAITRAMESVLSDSSVAEKVIHVDAGNRSKFVDVPSVDISSSSGSLSSAQLSSGIPGQVVLQTGSSFGGAVAGTYELVGIERGTTNGNYTLWYQNGEKWLSYDMSSKFFADSTDDIGDGNFELQASQASSLSNMFKDTVWRLWGDAETGYTFVGADYWPQATK